jgi:DUF4097 and DUF4098 domain-containing protein YvlB
MTNARNYREAVRLVVVAAPLLSFLALAQQKKEFNYTVGPKAVISITNNCGSITVKPSGNRQVLITAGSQSDAIGFVGERHGKRIEFRADCNLPRTEHTDYTLLVPVDAFISLRSFDGAVHASGLRGDVILETMSASIVVTDIDHAHLHVRTLGGPVSLTAIGNSHVDVQSVRGDVHISKVSGSFLEVHSGTGRITYDGDPGTAGDYLLASQSGDLEVSIPATASVEIKTQSIKGDPDQEVRNPGAVSGVGHRNLLMKPGVVNASRFVLRSFSGNIRLKRP